MSASRVAPAGSSTNLPWVTRQVSTYRSRAAGSSGTTSSSRRRCSPAGRSAAARAGAGRRGWRGAGWRPRGRCRGAGRSASALRWSPVLATVRWYSGPNCSCSRPVRRRCPSTTASSTITTTTTRIAITMPPFMAAPFLGPEEPTLGERLAGAPTRRRPLQTPDGSWRWLSRAGWGPPRPPTCRGTVLGDVAPDVPFLHDRVAADHGAAAPVGGEAAPEQQRQDHAQGSGGHQDDPDRVEVEARSGDVNGEGQDSADNQQKDTDT